MQPVPHWERLERGGLWGWRQGPRGRWGLRGSVLRSQGTWGQEELSRCRARGGRVLTFLCSLRADPLPLG
jgi:hypothetical protein